MTTTRFLRQAGTQLALGDWKGQDGVSPYLEPPTIPEGMTIGEYRRARRRRSKPLMGFLRWLA
jgi:hypothetical protein